MAFLKKSQTLNLTLFLLSILAIFTIVVQSQVIPDIHAVLAHHGLPPGLFPDAASSYNLTNGKLEVEVPTEICVVYVKSLIIRYERKLSGRLSYAKIEDVGGIRLLDFYGWGWVKQIERKEETMEFKLDIYEQTSVLVPATEFREIPKCTRPGLLKDIGVSRDLEDNRGVAVARDEA